MTTLNKIQDKQDVTIQAINDPSVMAQMVAIGFTIGAHIKVIAKLPFNGVIACESNHARFAIRSTDAAQIVVA
jgi:Fe2+ transport system protein FeoA